MSTGTKKGLVWFLGLLIFGIINTAMQPLLLGALVSGLISAALIYATFTVCMTLCRSIDDNAVIQSALLKDGESAAEEISWEGKRYDAVKYVIARTQFYYAKIRNNGETEPLLKAVNEKYEGYPFKDLDIRAINNAKAMYDEARKKKRAQQAEEEIQQDSENEGLRKAFGMYHDQED